MFRTLRELLAVVRQTSGVRGVLLLVGALLLAVPLAVCGTIYVAPFLAFGWVWNKFRGVGKRREDPYLGPIVYEGSSTWTAERDFNALGGRFTITLYAPRATGPGPAHHERVRQLLERQQEIRVQVQDQVFREYQEHAPQWRKDIGGDGWLASQQLQGIPLLERPEQIWTLLQASSITFEEEPESFTIFWECTWDSEHGVAVSFDNWQLQEIL